MNKIVKGIIFDGSARVAIINTTDIVNEEIKLHSLSPLAAAVLGRTMTIGAYISNNLKNASSTFSININGGGKIGSIVVAGNGGNCVRGFVGNPLIDLPLKKDGHLDVGTAVGTDGEITIIKDFGLKDPYVGKCKLVSGEIAEDFAQYLYTSEGIENTVALGVRVNKDGCVGAGGVIVELLPQANENIIYMIEDVMTNFSNISEIMSKSSPEEIFDFYFGHLNSEVYPAEEIELKCNCSDEKIESIIKGLGKVEAESIIEEFGKIEIFCQFCSKKYIYTKSEVEKLWQE